MSERTKKRIRGSISVLLVIILVPMMTLSAVIVDTSRINMAKAMVSSAGDLTMNAALADYDTVLKDVYGLFAMSQYKSDEELSNDLKEYFKTTLVSYGVTTEKESGQYVEALIGDFSKLVSGVKDGSVTNLMDMTIDDGFSAVRVPNSSLANAEIMRTQIVEYMKYRAPVNFGLSFFDSVKAFKNVQNQTAVVEKQVAAQESTQDVASACKNVITEIRDYDSLIDSIQSGDKAIKGKLDKNDGVTVPLEEYHEQLDRYDNEWADNYKDINLLTLVFFLKSPGVDSIYLKNLNYTHSEFFIKADNSGLVNDNSGISVSPSLADNTADAETQVRNQIARLNSGDEINTANSFSNAESFHLNSTYISLDYSNFTEENKAIGAFTAFEKFLMDDPSASVRYSSVKSVLEQIAILGKYHDNFCSKIDQDITQAESEKNAAERELNKANSDATTYRNKIETAVLQINQANKDWKGDVTFLNGIQSGGMDLGSEASALLTNTTTATPTITKTVGNKQFINYDGFLSAAYGGGGATNDYLTLFRNIADASIHDDDGDHATICSVAADYLEKRNNGKVSGSFTDYVKKQKNKALSENNLAKYMELLRSNSDRIATAEKEIQNYNSVRSNYQRLYNDAETKKQAYTSVVNRKANVTADFSNCLSQYNTFVKKYQADAYYYDKYVTTSKNVVSAKCAAVSTQFNAISGNVKSIIDKLTSIEEKLGTARDAIVEYLKKVNEWEAQKNSYENTAGEDSFSGQSEASIEAAKEQYNVDSLDLLLQYVGMIKEEYQTFYSRITDDTHFKYGNIKIGGIKTADDAKAASSGIKDSMPTVITVDDANAKFGELYNTESTPKIMHDELQVRWYFLKPTVFPTPFLRYLNENYPVEQKQVSNGDKAQNEARNTEYKDAKDALKRDSGSLTSSDDGGSGGESGEDKFGYTYKSKDRSIGSDLPSKNSEKKTVNTDGFQIQESDGKVNASNSFLQQSSALGSILNGIGKVAENALEDSYVLAYIFDNFSYNTIVQEAIIEGEKVQTYPVAISAMNKAEDYKGKASMLSGFALNGKNNHIYGAEVEYILYGNENAAINITYAKGSIYAIRFAFNCIYAFTNSEIRNTTMSAGLAVQAATLGVVPYQLVQIILQLALAAAESGLDLDMMSKGLKVAVLKSSETWQLSLSNAIKTVGQVASEVAADVAQKGIDYVSSGLQELIDASAGEIVSAVDDVTKDLQSATKNKAKEIVDAAFGYVQSTIEKEVTQLIYIDYANAHTTVAAEVDNTFNRLRSNLSGELEAKFGGNPVAQKVLPLVTGKVDGILNSVQTQISGEIQNMSSEAAAEKLTGCINDVKQSLVNSIDHIVREITNSLASEVSELTEDVSEELKQIVANEGAQISEEVSSEIKEKISDATNDFVNNYLDDGANAIGGGVDNVQGASGSSVASALKFGYKDYLMLFTFIALCIDSSEKAVLVRIADIIQMNLANGSTNGSEFKHKKGADFKMANANCYISIYAPVELNMLFMNMDFFANAVSSGEGETETEGQLTSTAKLVYKGLYGY